MPSRAKISIQKGILLRGLSEVKIPAPSFAPSLHSPNRSFFFSFTLPLFLLLLLAACPKTDHRLSQHSLQTPQHQPHLDKTANTNMANQYSPERLREIGDRNFNRLPPANTVSAMLEYELQRDAEHERLFHAAMFDVAGVKNEAAAQQSRVEALERTVKICAMHHKRNISLTAGSYDELVRHLQHRTNLPQCA